MDTSQSVNPKKDVHPLVNGASGDNRRTLELKVFKGFYYFVRKSP